METQDKLLKPKYIRVLSDLHLEQYLGQRESWLSDKFIPADLLDKDSVLVLAGDISSKPEQLFKFIESTAKRFQRIIFIPGNHEFYGHEMSTWSFDVESRLKNIENVRFETMGVGYEEMNGVRFIFTTLWADGGPDKQDWKNVELYLRDFYVIRRDSKRFTVPDMIAIHKGQKEKVKEYLAQPFDGKTVVISHHMPSYRLCHPRFGNSANGGFASNCDDILAYDNAPNLWIHGHTHDTIDTRLWKTRIVCNPSGYYMETSSPFLKYQPTFIDIKKMNEEKETG